MRVNLLLYEVEPASISQSTLPEIARASLQRKGMRGYFAALRSVRLSATSCLILKERARAGKSRGWGPCTGSVADAQEAHLRTPVFIDPPARLWMSDPLRT